MRMSESLQRLRSITHWMRTHKALTVMIVSAFFLAFGFFEADAQEFTDFLQPQTYLNLIVLGLAYIVNIIGYAVGKLIVVILGMIVIPILGYNNFADSNIIDIGWPLVRDVVNMFVIIIVLIVAVKTILGQQSANWQQQLPRLFVAVVLVNFSRTITLLIVDISQVVMFTFINALRDIAAGNFVNMFQLEGFLGLSSTQVEQLFETNTGLEGFGYLATAYVSLVFLIAILGVLLLLAAVFIYRVVIIWVLTILSPMAFFLGGVSSVVPGAGGPHSQWWKMLTGAAALGPILAFFLWLALAAASQGTLAGSEGFPTQEAQDTPTLYAEVLQIEQLLSLFIAIVLIMAGFQAASSAASGMGGTAAKLINEGTGKAIVKNAARLPARGGYRAARFAGRQIERRTGVGARTGKRVQQAGQRLAQSPLGRVGGRFVGRQLMRAGGQIEGYAGASVDQARTRAKEQVAGMTTGERVLRLQTMAAEGQEPFLMKDLGEQEALMADLVTNKGSQKALKATLKEQLQARVDSGDLDAGQLESELASQYDEIMRRAISHVGDNKDDLLDDKGKTAYQKTRAGHMRTAITAQRQDDGSYDLPSTATAAEQAAQDAARAASIDALRDIMTDPDFKVSQLSEEDVRDPLVREAMEGVVVDTYFDKDGKERKKTLAEKARATGSVSQGVKRALDGAGARFGADAAEHIARAIENGHLKVENITAEDIADPTRRRDVARGLALAGRSVSDVPDALRGDIQTALTTLQATATEKPSDREKYRQALYDLAQTPDEAHDAVGFDQATGNAAGANDEERAEQRRGLKQLIQTRPHQVTNLRVSINNNVTNDVRSELASAATPETFRELERRFQAADQESDAATRDQIQTQIRDSFETYRQAVAAELAAIPAHGGGGPDPHKDRRNNLRKKEADIARRQRYL